MDTPNLVLVLHTRLHRYAARYSPDYQVRLFNPETPPLRRDDQGRPVVSADLGLLLDPNDHSEATRRRGLLIPLRRRSVLLLFDRLGDEMLDAQLPITPLPPLLAERLLQPWASGVVATDTNFMVALDLPAIARHAATQAGAH